jgi:hypothetical protein
MGTICGFSWALRRGGLFWVGDAGRVSGDHQHRVVAWCLWASLPWVLGMCWYSLQVFCLFFIMYLLVDHC